MHEGFGPLPGLNLNLLVYCLDSGVHHNYRRTWLQYELLNRYFSLRTLWFLGPKQSLKWLEANDRNAFNLFNKAYGNPENIRILKDLADYTLKDC
ncbi:hypothetical protein GZ77_03160 [Endozoicomonas montiporae]|uniref:Uncharacterized protein n=1 Tax=Endozoicomonas montiporae TaxID=1027273 RepID=A0A081NAY8_9GAMM|nr:hypothetical protein GZ77_03160 [Endozoicomonas montiporae]